MGGVNQRRKNSHWMNCLLICAIAIFSTVNGQQTADTDPKNVTVLEGQSAALLCRWGQPLVYCRIEIPGEKAISLSPKWDNSPGLTYHGAGLEQGQCGVNIQTVRGSNHGEMKCFLGTNDGLEITGAIDIVVAQLPIRPEFEFSSHASSYDVGAQFVAKCISRDGRPASTLSWYLDDERITQDLSPIEIVESPGDTSKLFTSSQSIRRHLRAEDDRKFIICKATNVVDMDQPQEVRHQLIVRYRPIAKDETTVFGLMLDTTAMVSVTIKANPIPRTEWIIDGVAIPQGTQNARYESYSPVDLGNGMYNVTMSIAGLTLEDTHKQYVMRASNDAGSQDYTVRISSLAAAIDDGIGMGAVIGIVVAVLLVVIVISLVLFARATGRWCFGASSDVSPTPVTRTPNETVRDSTAVSLLPANEQMQRSSPEQSGTMRYSDINDRPVYNPTTILSHPVYGGGLHSTPSIVSDHSSVLSQDSNRSQLQQQQQHPQMTEAQRTSSNVVNRWLPHQQRELLQRQAIILSGSKSKETDIF